jgi:uncharacterized protein YlbG (UPF0298 family)
MNSFEQFIESSAQSYLQSVVYIDDRIYLPSSNDKVSVDGLPPSRGPFESEEDVSNEASSAIAGELVSSNADDLESEYVHPKQLTESFAEMGIVCALYEPAEGASVDEDSTIFKLCQRADIIVLDWDLSRDNGAKVSELIANLIQQSDEVQPHHFRLCAIYTNQTNLMSTAEALLANLMSAGCQQTKYDQDKLQLVSGATRILILGKPNVPGRIDDIVANFVVEEQHLAKRLLDDFSEMHRGLLSGLALKGLSSIRKNTKRLLDKFNSDLDGAFLLHRALVKQKYDREALEELPELMAGELAAILEDSLLNGFDYESVNEIIQLLDSRDGESNSDELHQFRQSLIHGNVPQGKNELIRYGKMVGSSSSEKFSILFNNRTQYDQVPQRLKFGTVVKQPKVVRKYPRDDSEGEWDYSICLMPICDSRDTSKAGQGMTYPFWKLHDNAKKAKIAALVIEDDHSTVSLYVGGKIRDNLWLVNMKLGDDGWAKPDPNSLKYEVIDQTSEIYWVAQLKPLHAQRIALYVGSEASKVGVTESEWLRLVHQRS